MSETKEDFIARFCEFNQEMRVFEPDNNTPADSVDWFRNYLYSPHPLISGKIAELKRLAEIGTNRTRAQNAEIGRVLEKIAYLAFKGLAGKPRISNIITALHQYDLLAEGDSSNWGYVLSRWFLDGKMPDVVVECKAEEQAVGIPAIARLCSVLDHTLCRTAGLAVVFTLKGLTGRARRGGPPRRAVGQATLLQILYSARSKKAIVALELEDIETLSQPGSLVQLIRDRIRELEQVSGIFPTFSGADVPRRGRLPSYLTELDEP